MNTNRIALLLALVSLPACASETDNNVQSESLTEELCDARCECETCSDSERSRCVTDSESFREDAEDLGCAETYDAVLECIEDTQNCDAGVYSTSCDAAFDTHLTCMQGAEAQQ